MFLLMTKKKAAQVRMCAHVASFANVPARMEVYHASHDEVQFSVMYPPMFATLSHVRISEECHLTASVPPEDACEVDQVEAALLEELRDCSKRTFARFKDEYDSMFCSSVHGSEVRLILDVDAPTILPQTQPRVDVSLTPVMMTVRPGRVFVTWSISLVDDPDVYDVPQSLRANQALGRASRARKAIEKLERSVETGKSSADEALAFLQKHGFLDSSSDEED